MSLLCAPACILDGNVLSDRRNPGFEYFWESIGPPESFGLDQ